MSYQAIKDYRNQAYRLSYPNARNIEVRRCRVSVLNKKLQAYACVQILGYRHHACVQILGYRHMPVCK